MWVAEGVNKLSGVRLRFLPILLFSCNWILSILRLASFTKPTPILTRTLSSFFAIFNSSLPPDRLTHLNPTKTLFNFLLFHHFNSGILLTSFPLFSLLSDFFSLYVEAFEFRCCPQVSLLSSFSFSPVIFCFWVILISTSGRWGCGLTASITGWSRIQFERMSGRFLFCRRVCSFSIMTKFPYLISIALFILLLLWLFLGMDDCMTLFYSNRMISCYNF